MTASLNPIFRDEDKARSYLEAQRWPDGPFCPSCGQLESVSALPLKGSLGVGWHHCNDCRLKFTVRVGTLYERSHVPLHKWLYATYLLACSKKGMSAHQLHRMLGVTYKTAWFMSHRIREGMAQGPLNPFGSKGGAVEADETFIGRKAGKKVRSGSAHKMAVLTLVDRDTKQAHSNPIANLREDTIWRIVSRNVSREARLMTDDARYYQNLGKSFADHQAVNHSADEWVRGDAHTNTAEGYFGVFKRGMKGTYQHCGEQHLHRYLAEFDFHYNNRVGLGIGDEARAEKALKGIEGKRLTYRRTCGASFD